MVSFDQFLAEMEAISARASVKATVGTRHS